MLRVCSQASLPNLFQQMSSLMWPYLSLGNKHVVAKSDTRQATPQKGFIHCHC